MDDENTIEPSRVLRLVVADSHHVDEQDPDPYPY